MLPTITLTLVDGVQIVVPNSLDLITPYVLQEQQDWFEDEIQFLRLLLLPGQKAIDIGANYGVYALPMARLVGPEGHVWAFEPAPETARLLAKGITANGFRQITLERAALSNARGSGRLSLNTQSELNSLIRDNLPATIASETVSVATLDDYLEDYNWRDIEFVKIDAEGEEDNILKGGARFFAELSPLVQYEIKAGDVLHLELVRAFISLGYDSYRLVPGPGLLVPFDAHAPSDGYILNLFACKPDAAARLAARGLLVASSSNPHGESSKSSEGSSTSDPRRGVYSWRNTLTKLSYGAQLAALWEQSAEAGHTHEVDEPLALYIASQDATRSAAERFCALNTSFNQFKALCDREPSHLRLASLARVARDFGARVVTVSSLTQLNRIADQPGQIDPSEPFLAPAHRFDSIAPGENFDKWLLSAVLEELERVEYFSSFYAGVSARSRLEAIRDLGLGSPEMARRLSLLQQRFGLPKS
jgi:FkbM family methyltransferase